jgi:hypothetical protein
MAAAFLPFYVFMAHIIDAIKMSERRLYFLAIIGIFASMNHEIGRWPLPAALNIHIYYVALTLITSLVFFSAKRQYLQNPPPLKL